ncbi:CDP-glycerol glycerophosphotransferase family protein [Neobacillus vireti]|uniref:CDP-glycerol glycerophosphotransferase n=1 Tax=Neobacillus vireti LMG 21834 TaxID=1131730 RepID=A0AB94IQ22_9BACI|nr:CDP-glycerol glycerophosphotransferase family protein [Neobacillus vireti]ETI69166.1 CDP-glycerol glycerophosphotransferase [Neobacillus vireti LMG 21834]
MEYLVRFEKIEANKIFLKKKCDFKVEELSFILGKEEVKLPFTEDDNNVVVHLIQRNFQKLEKYYLNINGSNVKVVNEFEMAIPFDKDFILSLAALKENLTIEIKWISPINQNNTTIKKVDDKNIPYMENDEEIKLHLPNVSDGYFLGIRFKGQIIEIPTHKTGEYVSLWKKDFGRSILPFGQFRLYVFEPFLNLFIMTPINLETSEMNTRIELNMFSYIQNNNQKSTLFINGIKNTKSIRIINHDNLRLSFSLGHEKLESDPALYLVSTDFNKFHLIESTYIEELNIFNITIPLNELNHSLYNFIIKINEDFYYLVYTNYFESPISHDNENKGFLFNDQKLNLYIGDKNLYQVKFKKEINGNIEVANIFPLNNFLVVETNRSNLPEYYEIYLVNDENAAQQFTLNHFYMDGKLWIDTKSIPTVDTIGCWTFYLSANFQRYILKQSITLVSNSIRPIVDCNSYIIEDQSYINGFYIGKNGLGYCQLSENKYLTTTRKVSKDNILVKDFLFGQNEISFSLSNAELDNLNTFNVILISRKTKKRIILGTEIKGNRITCHLTNTENSHRIESFENGRWDIFGEVFSKGDFIYGRIEHEEDSLSKKSLYYFSHSKEEAILIYQTDKNQMSVVKEKAHSVFKEKNQVETKLIELIKQRNSGYKFIIDLTSKNYLNIESAALLLRSKDNYKRIDISNIATSKSKKHQTISGTFNMNWDEFFPLYWDLFITATDADNQTGYIRVNGASKNVINKVNEDYFKQAIMSGDKSKILYPYVTFSEDISFMMRERESFETITNKMKESLAYYTYRLLKPLYFHKKNIWLGFEKFSKTAQDNGYAFFSYVDKNKLHEDFYFIIDKTSPDYQRIKKESNKIVPFMSFKYLLLVYASKLLVSSETKRHVHNIRIRSGKVAETINRKKSVFLQHGVTGLKRSDVFKKSKGRGNFDIVVATSDAEKEILKEHWNYESKEIIVTGFARWDLLNDKSNEVKKKKIFVMPTWRTWMEDMPKEEFVKSDYYSSYTALLTSSELNQLLVESNLELVFFLHPKFKQYISEFKVENENIKIKEFLDIKVNNEMMESSLMISDYSSVTWDMFFLNKPVIFYQFDHEKYNQYEGSYIDMDKELFGDRAINVDEIISELNYYVKHNFEVKDEYKHLREKYFKYTDYENSKRIFEEIKKRIK